MPKGTKMGLGDFLGPSGGGGFGSNSMGLPSGPSGEGGDDFRGGGRGGRGGRGIA